VAPPLEWLEHLFQPRGAHGNGIHRQVIETYLLMFEAVAEIGIEQGFKP
jgi:hypothetical protein